MLPLTTCEADGDIVFIDVAQGKKTAEIKSHTSNINSLYIKGNIIITGSRDGTIKLSNIDKKNELLTLISFVNGEWISITPEGYFNA